MEQGVAVRGLKERPVQWYSSTEAILEAVALGRAKAGYVISTRGPWLAQERWPGRSFFLPPAPRAKPPPGGLLSHLRRGAKDRTVTSWRRSTGPGMSSTALGPARRGSSPAGTSSTISRPCPISGRERRQVLEPNHAAHSTASLGDAGRGRARPGLDPVHGGPQAGCARRPKHRRAGRAGLPGPGGLRGRPGTVPRPVQRLSRRRRPRWQGPGPDRRVAGSTVARMPTSSATIKNGVPNTTMKKLGESLKDDQIAS